MMAVWLRWLLVALGIVGAGLNAWGLSVSFLVWIVANSGLVLLYCYTRCWPEVVLFGIYLVTAVVGWLRAGGWPA